MATGCIVAGFTGFGGRVYANSNNGFWAAEDDCLDAATQLAQALRTAKQGGPMYVDMVGNGLSDARRLNRSRFGGILFAARLI